VPKGNLVYVDWTDVIAIIFLIVSIVGIILGLFFAYSLHKYRDTALVQSLSPKFCYLIILGTVMGFIGVIVQAGTPTDPLCMSRIWLPGLAFSFVFSNVFVKTWRIWRIFDNKAIRKVVITDKELLISSFMLIAIETIALGFWSYQDPYRPEVEFGTPTIFICTSRSLAVYELAQEGWKLINLVFGVFLVWSTRNVVSTFNESKDIGFAMYNYFAATLMGVVFLALIPAGSATLYGLRALCECVIYYGILLILFGKKVYLLWKYDGEIPGMMEEFSNNSIPTMHTQADNSSVTSGKDSEMANPMFQQQSDVVDLDRADDFWKS